MKIKKMSGLLSPLGKIFNIKNDSKEDTYSCDYINERMDSVPIGTVMKYDGDNIPDGYIEIEDEPAKVLLWSGTAALATNITLNDYPENYTSLWVVAGNYRAIIPSYYGGSSVAGKSVIENSNYVRYEVYFYIQGFNNGTKQIQFSPTYEFRNGAFNSVVNITSIYGIK